MGLERIANVRPPRSLHVAAFIATLPYAALCILWVVRSSSSSSSDSSFAFEHAVIRNVTVVVQFSGYSLLQALIQTIYTLCLIISRGVSLS